MRTTQELMKTKLSLSNHSFLVTYHSHFKIQVEYICVGMMYLNGHRILVTTIILHQTRRYGRRVEVDIGSSSTSHANTTLFHRFPSNSKDGSQIGFQDAFLSRANASGMSSREYGSVTFLVAKYLEGWYGRVTLMHGNGMWMMHEGRSGCQSELELIAEGDRTLLRCPEY